MELLAEVLLAFQSVGGEDVVLFGSAEVDCEVFLFLGSAPNIWLVDLLGDSEVVNGRRSCVDFFAGALVWYVVGLNRRSVLS